MSVTDRHPGPWRLGNEDERDEPGFSLLDANGTWLRWDFGMGDDSEPGDIPAVKRLILAAPELLEALKRVGECCGCMDEEASALIERIEKGGT